MTFDGPTIVECSVRYGGGGLGQHFSHVVDVVRRQGHLQRYYSTAPDPADLSAGTGVAVPIPLFGYLARYTPVRFSPGWQNFLSGNLFDHAVAGRLTGPVGTFVGFGGQALHGFRRARQLGATRLVLVAANSHVDNVAAQHAKAMAAHPIEGSWLNGAQIRKTRREYDLADVILVASEYTRQTFLTRGVPAGKLRRIDYPTDLRFAPPTAKPTDDTFRVVCVGSLAVNKGVAVLVEAFTRLTGRAAELTLVGGWATRGMRQYLQTAMARDPRIRVSPGDPLPHLHRADVCVHPTYEDGFAYAPMEAIAAGVPVIVTEDTGMKEHVREGENGFVVPTGDVGALVSRLEQLADAIQRRAGRGTSGGHE